MPLIQAPRQAPPHASPFQSGDAPDHTHGRAPTIGADGDLVHHVLYEEKAPGAKSLARARGRRAPG